MPYNKKKQKCKQSDGDAGSYVLSYTDKKGEKHNNCHTSKKKMQGQIAAIEAEADMSDEEVLEETLRLLVKEVIVNFDGDDYDIPRDEVESIRQRLEVGYVGIGMPDEPDDRTFDLSKTQKRLEADLGGKEGPQAVEIIAAFDDEPRGEAVRIIANNIDDIKAAMFSAPPELDMKGTLPSSPAWAKLGRIKGDGLGRMEIALSLYLQNIIPDGGGGAHDLNVTGIGDTHVKDQPSDFSNPDARMGKQINNSDRAYPWFSSIVEAVPEWEGKSTNGELFKDNSVAILNAFAKATGSSDEEINTATIAQYDQWADEFQENVRESFFASESWGGAAALMFTNSKTGQFFLASPDNVAPYRLSQGKWRAGITSKQGDKFSRLLKKEARTELKESALRSAIGNMLTEELTDSDMSGDKVLEEILRSLLNESKNSDAFEISIAQAIDSVGENIKATRPSVGTQFADVLVEIDGQTSWLEVKMNSSDNLSNPRVFYDGSSWNTTYKTPTAKYAIDLLNNSADAQAFVTEISKFSGIPNPILPTTKGGLKDPNAVPLEVMREFVENRGGRYIASENDIDIGTLVTQHYTIGKEAPANYMQTGDSFYLIGNADPLELNSANGGKIPTLGGSGDFKMRVSTRSKFYEIQAEVKIKKFDPASSPFSALGGSKKTNPFTALASPDALIEELVRESLLLEDLTGSDKADIKRMIKKEIEGPTNRREVDKAFKKNFNAELKKALGVSFFGTPGKINKFVIDEIQKEVMKNLDSKASKDVIIFVCKEVIKKLYRELSFSSPQIIDRINPKV